MPGIGDNDSMSSLNHGVSLREKGVTRFLYFNVDDLTEVGRMRYQIPDSLFLINREILMDNLMLDKIHLLFNFRSGVPILWDFFRYAIQRQWLPVYLPDQPGRVS